ncbi:hypothetical protein [Aequorivita xiaoshiensis]|uniref:Uncharacterized protein n=1 Tax=Aequorivita xiaoshiensis TaxID=2874476 RepID=A0A9X1QXF2_9FLAO|nr:hypothetical protein [Aequorivita xiaoshiensis]MCG2430311.1 hypothetical protein [Aequorivita xiaoshiensis]
MRLILPCIAILIFSVNSFSQVGIGTTTPKSDLHISKSSVDGGSVQIDGGIRLGGRNTTLGSKGEIGQVLMSGGPTGSAKWVTLGKTEGYSTNCDVPNNIATINITLPDGSNGNEVNVTSFQMATALSSLPQGGIVLIRTNAITIYNNVNTRLTVQLPTATSVINKPFVIAFDGPINSNNLINHNKTIEILVKATEDNSIVYELGTVSTNRKFFINEFPDNNNLDYKISELENNSSDTQPILLMNSYTITAIDNKTWTFTNRDCYIQNPKS